MLFFLMKSSYQSIFMGEMYSCVGLFYKYLLSLTLLAWLCVTC